MKTNKFLVIAAMALGLGVFAACSNDDEPNVPESKGNTYVGVNIAFSGINNLSRALPNDYNDKGRWKGRDEIKTITIFMVNKEANSVDYTSFNENSFNAIDEHGFLKPTLAVKATKGHKVKSYVVINDQNDILTSTFKKVSAAEFETKFAEEVEAIASQVSTTTGEKDIILMTNDKPANELEVVQATKEQAINGDKNQCKVSVERVVARGIITMSQDIKSKKIPVKKDGKGEAISEIELTEVTYAVGQSNRKFFIMKKSNYETPSPVYTYIPNNNWNTTGKTYFDYAGLKNATEVLAIDNNIENVKKALTDEATSKFVIPVTHANDNYKKGNTTYFEVIAKFKPTKKSFAEGEEEKVKENTYYLGMNDGKFYASREAAAAVAGQKVTEYKNGTMKYILWLNPDKVPGATEGQLAKLSPTVRNQVYHAHISGFKEIGLPGNPLHPNDPNNPTDPEDPNNPENPENPIKPDDPLQTESTYLSVSITVLEWGMHSYEVDLGNDY
ncbi:Mfa1 family fimbria major subunit [Bacteroides pyogenes]|uniref:Mfa1 family fimbria major subunit n=1 Tax=Bacteroides pyogenes TaxID=310300 RepID=UPI002FDADF0B